MAEITASIVVTVNHYSAITEKMAGIWEGKLERERAKDKWCHEAHDGVLLNFKRLTHDNFLFFFAIYISFLTRNLTKF